MDIFWKILRWHFIYFDNDNQNGGSDDDDDDEGGGGKEEEEKWRCRTSKFKV